jgi:hypothetical protein
VDSLATLRKQECLTLRARAEGIALLGVLSQGIARGVVDRHHA